MPKISAEMNVHSVSDDPYYCQLFGIRRYLTLSDGNNYEACYTLYFLKLLFGFGSSVCMSAFSIRSPSTKCVCVCVCVVHVKLAFEFNTLSGEEQEAMEPSDVHVLRTGLSR